MPGIGWQNLRKGASARIEPRNFSVETLADALRHQALGRPDIDPGYLICQSLAKGCEPVARRPVLRRPQLRADQGLAAMEEHLPGGDLHHGARRLAVHGKASAQRSVGREMRL